MKRRHILVTLSLSSSQYHSSGGKTNPNNFYQKLFLKKCLSEGVWCPPKNILFFLLFLIFFHISIGINNTNKFLLIRLQSSKKVAFSEEFDQKQLIWCNVPNMPFFWYIQVPEHPHRFLWFLSENDPIKMLSQDEILTLCHKFLVTELVLI